MIDGGLFLYIQPNSSALMDSDSSTLYTTVLLLEILIIFINFGMVGLSEYLFLYKKAFHPNHTMLIAGFFIVSVPVAFVRVWYIVYILLGLDLEEAVGIQSAVRTLYGNLMVVAMPASLIERAFASVHLTDYEQKRRHHVVPICLLVAILLFLALCYYLFGKRIDLLAYCIEIFIITNITVIAYLALWKYNLVQLQKCKENNKDYKLSTRFQIEENIKTFKMIRGAFFIIAAIVVIFCGLAMVILFCTSPALKTCAKIAVEFSMSCVLVPVQICFIVSVPDWKHFVLQFFKKGAVRSFHGDAHRGRETDLYFQHLKNSWI